MNLLIICAVLFASTVYGQAGMPRSDGRPGCSIRYEFRRSWRNNFVPEQYWECRQWGQPAERRYCPEGTRFADSWQTCVPYMQWQWTPYSEPPTVAGAFFNEQCVEIVMPQPDACLPGGPVEPWNPSSPRPEGPEGPFDPWNPSSPRPEGPEGPVNPWNPSSPRPDGPEDPWNPNPEIENSTVD